MALDHLAFDQITHTDLLRLIENGVAEDRFIDYKRDPIGGNDDAKREFLKDVSAFGNASGGYIVFGMDEEKSVPTDLVGVCVPDIGAELQRLEGMIRDNLEPRLVGVQIRQVPEPNGDPAILIHIPRSWNPPHRVTFKGWNKFFVRNSNGAHEMSVQELRSQFLSSATLAERIQGFRSERIDLIAREAIEQQNAAPNSRIGKDRLVMHIIPLASVSDAALIDIKQAHTLWNDFFPISTHIGPSGGFDPTFNFDGLIVKAGLSQDGSYGSYTQVFRNGIIETACAWCLFEQNGVELLMATDVEKFVIAALPPMCGGLAKLQVGPPVVILMSLVNVGRSYLQNAMFPRRKPALDRSHLPLPSVTLDTLDLQGAWHRIMKVPFDAMWNAYGYEGSPSFQSGA